MALDTPEMVLAVLEVGHGALEIAEAVEAVKPEDLLLEGADEAFSAAVALRPRT